MFSKSFGTIISLAVVTVSTAEVMVSSGGICPSGFSEMSVQGVEGIYCVPAGHECVAGILGDCPRKQPGLEYGSYCGFVAPEVYGCKVLTAESIPTYQPYVATESHCDEDELEISVEGLLNAYCLKSDYVCTGARYDGECPGAQPGLPDGSYCDLVSSGIFGCKPFNGTEPTLYVPEPPRDCEGDVAGESAVSVEGAGTFCASGTICSGTVYGNCPKIQEGLPVDSKCVIVSTGVFGCAI